MRQLKTEKDRKKKVYPATMYQRDEKRFLDEKEKSNKYLKAPGR